MSDEGGKRFSVDDDGRDPRWERDLINRLVFASLNEQRRARRWGIFFKLFMVVYLLAILLLYLPDDLQPAAIGGDRHTALIDLKGVIGADTEASADNVVSGLRAAFEHKKTAGVVLRINSPGGSPVQSGYINREITRLRKKYPDIPLYAVITDICASGGYYVAAAADEIYADKASIVGSIGVIMNGFGFVEAIDKLGVERRLYTAGENKGLLDPFSPEDPREVSHIQGLLDDIHQQFIDTVRAGRGDRLKDDDRIFSGLIWTGEQGIELGLVDRIGNASYVAREVIGAEDIVDFTLRETYLDQVAKRLGETLAGTLGAMLASPVPRF